MLLAEIAVGTENPQLRLPTRARPDGQLVSLQVCLTGSDFLRVSEAHGLECLPDAPPQPSLILFVVLAAFLRALCGASFRLARYFFSHFGAQTPDWAV
jgi:hypothetical protein